jgi:hypothetical protein
MRPNIAAVKTWLAGVGLLLLASCSGGIKAGGEEPTNNGGIAFIAFAIFLVLTAVIMWLILGRKD